MSTSQIPTSTPPAAVLETLERLSSKSGVVATLALDRSTSTVLASTGNLQALSASGVASTTSAPSTSKMTASAFVTPQNAASAPSHLSLSTSSTTTALANTTNTEGVFDLPSRIWQYVKFSGQLVQDMDSEDDLKLLRLRTKKHEFMIVPDPKYIFVVVHEVSS